MAVDDGASAGRRERREAVEDGFELGELEAVGQLGGDAAERIEHARFLWAAAWSTTAAWGEAAAGIAAGGGLVVVGLVDLVVVVAV